MKENPNLRMKNTFTQRNSRALNKRFFGSLLLLLAIFSLGNMGSATAQNHNVTHLYTDFGGYWSSGAGKINLTKPNDSHNLLGFKYNGINYSTGVSDQTLSDYGIIFQPMEFQAFPVLDVPIRSGEYRYGQFGELTDGIANGVHTDRGSMPFSLPIKLSDMLTDGIQGLDISTGVTNMWTADNKAVKMEFSFTSIENRDEIGNGIPDILVTQIASPDKKTHDKIWFEDAEGKPIGNPISIIQEHLPVLGESLNDFFDPETGLQDDWEYINSERPIRMSAFEASEFGLDATNYHRAHKLIYEMGGKSDPAFLAFNTNLIKILVANDDKVTTVANESVDIDILENDTYSETVMPTIKVTEGPSNGRVEINGTAITYIPNPGYHEGDSFIYELCSTLGSTAGICDSAMVTIVVGAADLEIKMDINDKYPSIGDIVWFTLTVTNKGDFTAPGVLVRDVFPSGYNVTGKTKYSRGDSYNISSGEWKINSLADGATATLQIEVQLNPTGEYTNTAEVSSAMFDPDLSNNKASYTPGNFLSASLSKLGCQPGGNYQQVQVELTGVGPWELTYSMDGKEYSEKNITDPLHVIEPKGKGVFLLTSVKDAFTEGSFREIKFSTTPSTRLTIGACKVVSNPGFIFKAKKTQK